MSYQYLFCATCGVRRAGHSYRCDVCNSLLRRPDVRVQTNIAQLQPVVRAAHTDRKLPVAA